MNMTLDKLVRANIILWRKKSKLTQRQVAKKLGVSVHTVSRWETGKAYPSVMDCETLATVFRIPSTFLFQEWKSL